MATAVIAAAVSAGIIAAITAGWAAWVGCYRRQDLRVRSAPHTGMADSDASNQRTKQRKWWLEKRDILCNQIIISLIPKFMGSGARPLPLWLCAAALAGAGRGALGAASKKPPPLGWSSWYAMGQSVNQSAMEETFKKMVNRYALAILFID